MAIVGPTHFLISDICFFFVVFFLLLLLFFFYYYFSFIRPLLEYADVVWDNCTQYEVDELEKIQIEAARIVTRATKLVSIDSLYTETGWETLSSRRLNHKRLFLKTHF